MNIFTGEKIQQICDIYLGIDYDFTQNPIITPQIEKHVYLNKINTTINNPYRIFCYSHNVILLSQKIDLFQNDFVLITHNSDQDIRATNEVIKILNCDKLLKWYGQNVCFEHSKLYFLPIGIANSQWSHGNLSIFYDIEFITNIPFRKNNKVYFNFNIHTNQQTRQLCYNSLITKLKWLDNVDPLENLKRLSEYFFCICPQGNGVDTHRLWECLYLKVVPIVIKSEFTSTLLKNHIPLVVLDNWDFLDINKLKYSDHNFDDEKLKNILSFSNNYVL